METSEEPLNLTVNKMPIAILAPFTVVDKHLKIKSEADGNLAEDLSSKMPLDLTKNNNYANGIKEYLSKNEEICNSYDNNIFALGKEGNFNIYSVINCLDNKLFSTYYMNTFLKKYNEYGCQCYLADDAKSQSNKILNNLIDRKFVNFQSIQEDHKEINKKKVRCETLDTTNR